MSDDVLDLLRRQRGLIAGHQVCRIEPDRNRRRQLYRRNDVEWASPRVLRHLAAPRSIEQELILGVLDAGEIAALWGKPAASHWGFSRFRRLPAHVGVPRRAEVGNHVAQVHLLRHLDPVDVTTHCDVPIARPEVVVLWLAGMWTHRLGPEVATERTAVALDQAWRQRLIDETYLRALAERSGGHGRSGIVAFRSVLEDRPAGYQPAGSQLEERFESILPPEVRRKLRRQLCVDVNPITRVVDFGLADWPLIVEINGEAVHSSLTARTADDERYARLLSLGYSVVVFWEYDVWNDARAVAAAMRRLAAQPDRIPTLHRPTRAPWEA